MAGLFLLLALKGYNQSAIISSYYNAIDVRDEWTEILVIQDDLDMRNWTIRDNNQTQTNWQQAVTFSTTNPLWQHLRSGTIIMLWHRKTSSTGVTHWEKDVIKMDGYIELSIDDGAYFFGGNFGSSPLYNGPSMNIYDGVSGGGDIIQLRNSSTANVHALGNRISVGTDFTGITGGSKLNHSEDLLPAEALFVCPGNDQVSLGNPTQIGTTYTAKAASPNITFGLPNTTSTWPTQNSDYWRRVRQPIWSNPGLTATPNAAHTQVTLSWNTIIDPFVSDGTLGYIILRNTTGIFTPPDDGTSYTPGSACYSATVIANITSTSSATLTYTDNFTTGCGNSAYYRMFAYRYKFDDLNGNTYNVARGRQYDEDDVAHAEIVFASLPVAFALTGDTSLCSGSPGVLLGLSGSETTVNYQLYINGSAVGAPVPGSGIPIDFGLQTAPGVYTVVATSSISATCSTNMLNSLTLTTHATPSFNSSKTDPSNCGSADGSILLTSLAANTNYILNYFYNLVPMGPFPISSDASGSYTIGGLVAGNYTGITVSHDGCTSLPDSKTLNEPSSVIPGITISPDNTTICSGIDVTFTAIPSNEGSAPTYQWQKNSSIVGVNSNTYIDNTLISTDIITCTLTSSDLCANPPTAQSNSVSVMVLPTGTPSIVISPDNDTVCQGTLVTFEAIYMMGGTYPVFQWMKNSMNVGVNLPTYQDNTLTGSDVITCQLTSNDPCSSASTVISNPSSIAISGAVIPSISVDPDRDTICSGSSVTFTAISTNGGGSPSYQWKKNGINVGANNYQYTDNSLTGSDFITCELTSSESCANPASILSGPVSVVISSSVTPSITIHADNDTICIGSPVLFSAVPVNGGNTPAYQWKKNSGNVGSNSDTYSDNFILNGDIITCQLISSDDCASTPTANSNAVSMVVTTTLAPSITIMADHDSLCAGTNVTFSAQVSNQGFAPVYQWKKNGIPVGTNLNTYSDNNLLSSDEISCILVSDASCASPNSASSNVLSLTINTPPFIQPPDTTGATNNLANGSMVISATGSGTLSYSIDNGLNWTSNTSFTGLSAKNYTVLVQDGNGCITSKDFTITNTMLSVSALQADIQKDCPGKSILISVNATGLTDFMSFDICLAYDPSIARFIDFTSLNPLLTGMTKDASVPGKIVLSWDGLASMSIPDGELLFELQFLGISSGSTSIDFVDFQPGICGIFDPAGAKKFYTFSSGKALFYEAPKAIIIGENKTCLGAEVNLIAAGDTLQHSWTLPDGSSYYGEQITINEASDANAGPYVLRATNIVGCSDQDTLVLEVHPLPDIQLAASGYLCSGQSYNLDAGTGYSAYLWQDGSTSSSFPASGDGYFWVRVTDSIGCEGYDTVQLVPCPAAFFIPSAFSPNHDGLNDYFRARYSDLDVLEDYKLIIINRWGQTLFESPNINDGWDGTFNGSPCPTGEYIYIIKFSNPPGKMLSQKSPIQGALTLIR